MKLASVFGTRPQLVKVAAMLPALGHHTLIDTGQHWDERMAGAFITELRIPTPDHVLGIHGGSHGDQTGRMLGAIEAVLTDERPDAVIVYGDTNSTAAGALAAAKLGIRVAHVESGLRSFDRTMPEEINRIVADHLSYWCFAPTREAERHLALEGIAGIPAGDPMLDMVADHADAVMHPRAVADFGVLPGQYIFATIHRAENRRTRAVEAWTAILGDAARRLPVILALHPGTAAVLGDWSPPLGVRVIEPVGYRESLALQANAFAVVTDSGGVERESSWFGTPCLVLRSVSEWNFGTLVGLARDASEAALDRIVPAPRTRPVATRAAEAIARELAA